MHGTYNAGTKRSGFQNIFLVSILVMLVIMLSSCGGGGGGGFMPAPDPEPLPSQGNWPSIPAGAVASGRHGSVKLTGGMPIEMIVYHGNVPIKANGSHTLEVPTGSHTAIDYDIFIHAPTVWTDGGASVGGWQTMLATDFQREGGEFFFQPTFTYGNGDLQRSSNAEFARLLHYSMILASRDKSVPLTSGMRLCGDVIYEVHISQTSFAEMILLRVLPPRPAPPQNPGGGGGGGRWNFTGVALLLAFALFEPQDGGTIGACTTYQQQEPGTPPAPTPDTDIELLAPAEAAPGSKFDATVSSDCPKGWALRNVDTNVILATGKGNKSVELTMTTGPLRLRVDDGCGNTDSKTVNPKTTVPVENLKPSVSLVANPATSTVANATDKKSVELAAIAQDADGIIVKLEFDRDGDGTFEHTASITPAAEVQHSLSFDYPVGTHTPRVRATDDDGATATTSVTVTVTHDGGGGPQGTLGYNIVDSSLAPPDGWVHTVTHEVFRTNEHGQRVKTYSDAELVSIVVSRNDNGQTAPNWVTATKGYIYTMEDADHDGNPDNGDASILAPGDYTAVHTYSDGTTIGIPITVLSS